MELSSLSDGRITKSFKKCSSIDPIHWEVRNRNPKLVLSVHKMFPGEPVSHPSSAISPTALTARWRESRCGGKKARHCDGCGGRDGRPNNRALTWFNCPKMDITGIAQVLESQATGFRKIIPTHLCFDVQKVGAAQSCLMKFIGIPLQVTKPIIDG